MYACGPCASGCRRIDNAIEFAGAFGAIDRKDGRLFGSRLLAVFFAQTIGPAFCLGFVCALVSAVITLVVAFAEMLFWRDPFQVYGAVVCLVFVDVVHMLCTPLVRQPTSGNNTMHKALSPE